MSDLGTLLLEAHVQHELSRWRGDALPERLRTWVTALFDWMTQVKLDDVATASQIMGVIERYVIDLRVSGGIAELAGETSQIVFSSRTASETRLDEVVVGNAYEAFTAKLSTLEDLRRELISLVARSEAFDIITARLIARILSDLLLGSGAANKLVRKLLPALDRGVEAVLTRRIEHQREQTSTRTEQNLLEALDHDFLRSVADEVWAAISGLSLADAFKLITQNDLEDFVVLCYDFWLNYRKTPYFHRISEEVVAHFFDKYGQQTLAFLVDDMGVTEEMVAQELSIFLGPLVAEASRTGFLEQQVREQLQSFYSSATFERLLSEHGRR